MTSVRYLILTLTMLISAWPVQALTPLDEREMAGIHANQGIAISFENFRVSRTTEQTRFEPHNNVDALNNPVPNHFALGLGNLKFDTAVNGTLTLETRAYKAKPETFWVNDVRKTHTGSVPLKTRSFFHKDAHHTLSGRVPEINNRNRQAIVLKALATNSLPFVQTSFSAEVGYTFGTGEKPPFTSLGRLEINGTKIFGAEALVYPISNIPGYASGQGVAFALGLKTSINRLTYKSSQGQALLTLSGIHLRESFNRNDYNAYDHLGNPIKNNGDISGTTGDAGGYQPGDERNLISRSITSAWGTYTPGTNRGIHNMYGGRFMIGNTRQVGFYDHVSGNGSIPVNRPWNRQVSLNDNGEDVQDGQINSVKIQERPVTFQVKKRADGSTYIAINLTIHGSIRVENVVGYDSGNTNLGGNSMGPIILDGIRVKYCEIEFPGPKEIYTLTTIYGSNSQHNYLYRAGHLPIAQNLIPGGSIPSGQAAHNPMGRGQEWYLSKLGNPNLPSHADWDSYRVQYKGKDFWRIQEPDPPSNYF